MSSSSEAPSTAPSTAPAPAPAPTSASEAPAVNFERKARKEAQQAASKKAAKAHPSSPSPSPQSTSSSTTKPKHPPRAAQSPMEQLSRALAYILRHGAEKENLPIRPDGYIPLSLVLDRPRVKSVNMAEGEGEGKRKRKPGVEDVKRVVERNDKKRFEVMQDDDATKEWWVRAVQGHSLKQVVKLEHIPLTLDNLHLLSTEQADEDEDVLADEVDKKLEIDHLHHTTTTKKDSSSRVIEVIHGTNSAAWEQILASGGLKPMGRNHIHLAKGKFGQAGVISGMRKNASRLIYVDIKKAIQDGVVFVLSSNGVVLTPGAEGSGLLSVKYFTRVEDSKGKTVWLPEMQN